MSLLMSTLLPHTLLLLCVVCIVHLVHSRARRADMVANQQLHCRWSGEIADLRNKIEQTHAQINELVAHLPVVSDPLNSFGLGDGGDTKLVHISGKDKDTLVPISDDEDSYYSNGESGIDLGLGSETGSESGSESGSEPEFNMNEMDDATELVLEVEHAAPVPATATATAEPERVVAPLPPPYHKWSVKSLRRLATRLGLKTKLKKPELIVWIESHNGEVSKTVEPEEPGEDEVAIV